MNLSDPAKKNSPVTWAESQQPTHSEHRERIQKANWCLPEPFFSCLGHQKARLVSLQIVLLSQIPASPISFSSFLGMHFTSFSHGSKTQSSNSS